MKNKIVSAEQAIAIIRDGDTLACSAPFVWRCPSNLAVAPFPHPAHRTGRAVLPHPALGQDACFRPRNVALCLTEQQ